MPHVDHPEVIQDRIIIRLHLPDPSTKRVLVVETAMPTSTQHARYDEEKFKDLIAAVETAMYRFGADEAEIVPV